MDKKRILIFEASDIFADMVLEFLKTQGYETDRAVNGLEGIKKVYTFLPHLIITDVEMPLIKGDHAARLLKSHAATRPIPIIVFTSLNETKDKFWGGQAGADCYIAKSPENLTELSIQIEKLLYDAQEGEAPDYELIKKESKRIDDKSIIETLNNLLDNKLFQATVIALLAELSSKMGSLEEIVKGVFELLSNICEAEICSVMIKDVDNALIVYSANNAGFSAAVAEDFTAITIADFNTHFPDYQVLSREVKDFFPAGENKKRIESYVMLGLKSAGEEIASVHIANSIKEYFSPLIMENLNVFLTAAAPIIANALRLKQMASIQKKTRLAFARYVPIDVMDEIISKSAAPTNQSESRVIAILFSDIVSFTKISEKTNAQDMVNFLNVYFDVMCNEIVSEGGNIDKFIGDAIMGVFGAPKALDNAAVSAIKAAIKMASKIKDVDTSTITLPESGFGAGIGLNFGECIVGNIGFHDKLDYTVIGDAVNLASRLEGLTRIYKHPIIVSENMYEAAKDEFIFRKLDVVRVKGKNEPVGIYAVYAAFAGEAGAEAGAGAEVPRSLILDKKALDQYEKGLKLFFMKEFETAKQYFTKVLLIDEKDYLAKLYLERINNFIKNPPPEDWDGTITMTEK
jgi:class 3 adenylate cyclase/DNA-binding response OmpR family regulator